MTGRLCCHDRSTYCGGMATTVNRSTFDCSQRVVDRQAEIVRLTRDANSYDRHSEPGCAFEAARLRRIAAALTQR